MRTVNDILSQAVTDRAFPGGVLAVGTSGMVTHRFRVGRFTYADDSPAVRDETIYDLASLTKVMVTTTLAMMLVDRGRLDLDRPVRDLVAGFAGGLKARVTTRHLLSHSSGLPAWAPLFRECRGKGPLVRRIADMDLGYEPGTQSLYSDLGFILLGEVVEQVEGETIESLFRERIQGPLGIRDTGFLPEPTLLPRIAPTESDPWRGRLLRGEVHDENAFAMGGVAPHAGLFGTGGDVARFARMMLSGGELDGQGLVSAATIERFSRPAGIAGSSRALGWDTPSPGSSAGSLLSSRSFGHTGFTGTSLWIDPGRDLFIVLLTNRVHPSRQNDAIRKVRPAVADAVVQALDRI